jgi:serine/threonine protein kinase
MGVVYRARQLSLKRQVALKLIRDGALAGPEQQARFRIEAEAAARMSHTNIVAIYEVGEHQGRPYFAMELVEGPNLEQLLAGQAQAARPAAQLLRTLAHAIHHAHTQNVVHRDLKPANVLLQKSEVSDQKSESQLLTSVFCPKITDFGLAKRLDSASTALTQEGAVVGTPSYMAPEQAEGRVRDIGPATDVYALGAMLYELLTGRPPFVADSWPRVIEQILHAEPALPARLRPEVPPDLETICLKCLEKEPARRYSTALELANDLGRFLDGQLVAAVPVSPAERLARLAARDGYQIMDEIGRRPASTVYRARQGALPQPLAVKVFRTGTIPREEWDARLRRAADSWAALAHPHLVPVQRTGWWDNAPYVIMEYVPHGNLAARLTGKPYPISEALKLVEQLAEVVGYLHRQGVVHGNLKPSNILFAADGIPRVCDLQPTGGLFQGPLPINDSPSTDLAYLAPEVLQDSQGEPRPYTDIYGLGMILYELLTARPPFSGPTAEKTLDQVRSQEPISPSHIDSRIPASLDAFCLRCLRKDPWQRYARAYAVASRLRFFLDQLTNEPGGLSHR